MSPAVILSPRDETDAAEIVRDAPGSRQGLAIVGGGSRAGLGHPATVNHGLSTGRLTGVTLYEPSEMIVSARAGTPLSEIDRLLAEGGQMLAFEPMDHRPLFGTSGEPSIGAVAACNISGPGRIQAGAARDALLGLRLINGRAETIRSGGRVMKNVTGLDLARLCCGAHGTLGLLTEVTFRTQPKPESSATLVFRGLSDRRGIALLTQALGSAYRASGAAHLPAGIAASDALTLLRVDGFAHSVVHRIACLRTVLAAFGDADLVEGNQEAAHWRGIRDASLLAEPRARAVWRVSLKAVDVPSYVDALATDIAFAHFYDWGGGLVWIAVEDRADGGAGPIRQRLTPFGGHATLVRAPQDVPPHVRRFQPLSDGEMRLSRAVKASFDPHGILNLGRMYPGR